MENKKSEQADLRKKSGHFFLMGLSIALSFSLVAFEWKTPVESLKADFSPRDIIDEPIELPPVTLRKVPKITQPQPKLDLVPPKPDFSEPIVKEIVDNTTTEPTIDIEDEGPIVEDPLPAEPPVVEPPLVAVEQMPQFLGGERELFRYLGSNLKYPAMARDMGTQGIVWVQFVVNKDGSIVDTEILRGIGGGCDEEALRVVKKMPKWKPGFQGGKKVRVLFRLPINFILKN